MYVCMYVYIYAYNTRVLVQTCSSSVALPYASARSRRGSPGQSLCLPRRRRLSVTSAASTTEWPRYTRMQSFVHPAKTAPFPGRQQRNPRSLGASSRIDHHGSEQFFGCRSLAACWRLHGVAMRSNTSKYYEFEHTPYTHAVYIGGEDIEIAMSRKATLLSSCFLGERSQTIEGPTTPCRGRMSQPAGTWPPRLSRRPAGQPAGCMAGSPSRAFLGDEGSLG